MPISQYWAFSHHQFPIHHSIAFFSILSFQKQRESQIPLTMMYFTRTENQRRQRLNSDPQIWSSTKWPSDLQLITRVDAGGPVQPMRPVAFGSALVGLSISCFLYLLPSLVCATTYHAFLATIFLMASIAVPFITSILVTYSIKSSWLVIFANLAIRGLL